MQWLVAPRLIERDRVMAHYVGTTHNDSVTGVATEYDTFVDFGIGADTLVGGKLGNTFVLSVDELTDRISGSAGEDLIDYSRSDHALTIDIAAGKITALFGGGLDEVLHYGTVAYVSNIEDVIGSRYSDTIKGTNGDNIIEGGAGADKIAGLDGRDTASYAHSAAGVQVDLNNVTQHGGDAEGDQLYSIENLIGSSQNDRLIGDGSVNDIEGGAGADYINGNGGGLFGDFASYAHSAVKVQIDLHNVTQHGGDAEGDQLYNIDSVIGSAYNDRIVGNDHGNWLIGGDGDDTFYHTLGDDIIEGGTGSDTYVIGQISGTAGVSLALFDGSITLFPDNGNPFADNVALWSIENLVGSQNDDILDGSLVNSAVGTTINGAGGHDTIYGSGGSDHLYGSSGNDHLHGGNGVDFLFGGADDDWLEGGAGADRLDGESGNNWVDYSQSARAVEIHLQPQSNGFFTPDYGTGLGGDANGDQLYNIQNVSGSAYDDSLFGDGHDNILAGLAGNNTLDGGLGSDTLISGTGNDSLYGGGHDVRGSDTFEFQLYGGVSVAATGGQTPSIGNDTIYDWEAGDRIVLLNQGQSQVAHVDYAGHDTVITFDGVNGSITVLGVHASYTDLFGL
jgi:Ca2+-binding RTX toxin-like protein